MRLRKNCSDPNLLAQVGEVGGDPETSYAFGKIGKAVESALEMPMARQFDVVFERDSEGYFVASVPALPGCHTQVESIDELLSRVREAIALCLEGQNHSMEDLEFIGLGRVTVTA